MKNFLSFGKKPTVFNFDASGTYLISGENLDDASNGKSANGVGKSSIINALTYALYNKPISNISKDNLVNNINKKDMEVIVEFEKDDIEHKVKRTRKSKGGPGNHVQYFRDDKDITPDSIKNTDKMIEDALGIPYELFIRIVVFSATHTPFLDLPVRSHQQSNQTDIIEELFDLKKLSQMAEKLKEQTKENEQRLEVKLTYVNQLKSEHQRHHEQVKAAKQRLINWDKQNKTEIEAIKTKIHKTEGIDIEEQHKLHEELKELKKQTRETDNNQSSYQRELKQVFNKQKKITQDLAHLKDEKCPYCLQTYKDSNKKISECENELESLKENIDKTTLIIKEYYEIAQQLEIKHNDIKNQISVDNIEELIDIKNKISYYERSLRELENAINPFVEPLDELEVIALDDINMEEINQLSDHIEHQKFLQKLLTKKDSFVRKVLLNKHIPYLNKQLNIYLSYLGLSHSVEFTHEMTAKITQFGRQLDFGNLSNGQRARVNIALSFAFRDILQSVHEKINICLLDEVLDVGLDAIGVQSAATMLKKIARDQNIGLYIISHRDEVEGAFDNNIVIQLSNGFSSILSNK